MRTAEEWTVDQALLWLGTGQLEVVAEASPMIPQDCRSSWIIQQILCRGHDDRSMRFGVAFAEHKLLDLLQCGDAMAFIDGNQVKSSWFYRATLQQAGDFAASLLLVDATSMIFCRQRDEPEQYGALTRRGVEGIAPLIPSASLLRVIDEKIKVERKHLPKASQAALVKRFDDRLSRWLREGKDPVKRPTLTTEVASAMEELDISRSAARSAFQEVAKRYSGEDWSTRGRPSRHKRGA